MIPAQATKFVPITPPGAIVDNASYTTAEIDTDGFDYCQVYCFLGATDIGMVALKVQESDTTGTGFADVSGATFDGGTDIAGATAALPADDDDDSAFVFELDLRHRERFLDLVATAGDGASGTFMAAFAILSRANKTPLTAAEMGAANVVRV